MKMNDTNGNDERGHPVRRLLKSLPQVESTEDFEARLQRRIAEEEGREDTSGIFAWLAGIRRIPVFAYSMISVIVVGVVSYFLLIRTSPVAPPAHERLAIPENREELVPAPPVDNLQKKSGSSEWRHNAASGDEVAVPTTSGGNGRRGKQVEGKMLETAVPGEKSMTSTTDLRKNEPASVELAAPSVTNENAVVRGVTQGMNAIGGNSALFKAARAVTPTADSASRRDSLRLDSLQRLKTDVKHLKKKPSE